jgi:hypothetical protein
MKYYEVVFYHSGGTLRTYPLPEEEIKKIKKWLLEDNNKPYYIEYPNSQTESAVFFKSSLVCVDFDKWKER